jgi:DNA-binding response OmpR family regulator
MPTVLVADDNTLIAVTLSAILKQQKYTVVTATSLGEVEQITRGIRPDLVLLDVNFGRDHSLNLAKRLRQQAFNLLLISGESSTADLLMRHGWLEREVRILAKPIHPLELLREIHAAVTQQLVGLGHADTRSSDESTERVAAAVASS